MSTRAQCTECGQIKRVQPSDYARFTSDPDKDIATLAAETNPNLSDVEGDAMRLWIKMHENPKTLSADERQTVVDRVVAAVRDTLALRHAVTARNNIRIDPSVAIATIAPFLLLCLSLIMFDKAFETMGDAGQITLILGGFFVMPVVCGFAMWWWQKRRFRRQLGEMLKSGTDRLKLPPADVLALVGKSPDCTPPVRRIAEGAL